MSNESTVRNLLNGVEFDDSRLYSLLDKLVTDFYALQNQVNPPTTGRVFGLTGVITGPLTVDAFTAFIYNNNVKLAWVILAGIITYELRYVKGAHDGSSWDTATPLLRTTTNSADINPVAIPLTFGDHTFLLKTIDATGSFSSTAAVLVINIPTILASSITTTVISNFVLLNWTAPVSTFLIDHFNVYKNGVKVGESHGTFTSIFETIGGTYSYAVEAVDIVGNVGTISPVVTLAVSNPVDFTLHSVLTSIFDGNKINCFAFNR